MNLTSLRVDLKLKEKALRDSESTLKFFKKAADTNIELIEETESIIKILKGQIKDIEDKIRELEKRAKKKK